MGEKDDLMQRRVEDSSGSSAFVVVDNQLEDPNGSKKNGGNGFLVVPFVLSHLLKV